MGEHPARSPSDLRVALLQDIGKAGVSAGSALPSIRQIAKTYGVSKALVERTVRRLVEEGICRAEHGRGVFLAVEDPLDAVVEISTIGVVFGFQEYPKTDHPFYRQVFEGFQEWIAEHGYNQLKLSGWRTKSRARKAREIGAFADRLGGIIALGIYSDADCLLLRDTGVPVVVLDYDTGALGIDCAVLDNYSGMLALGREVAARLPGGAFFVSMWRADSADPAREERRAALEKALGEAGMRLPTEASLELAVSEGASVEGDAARLSPIIGSARDGKRPPAVVCDDSYIVPRVAAAMGSAGLTASKDYLLAYAGPAEPTDDIRPWPAIVAAYDFRELGRAGARLLEERITRGPGRAAKAAVGAKVVEYVP